MQEFKIKSKSGQFKPSACVRSCVCVCEWESERVHACGEGGREKGRKHFNFQATQVQPAAVPQTANGPWLRRKTQKEAARRKKRGMNMHFWKSLPSSVWKEHQKSELISGGSTVSSDVHPHSASIPLHPSLSHDEMDDGERACGTEGGRDGLYLLNTWWMWSSGLNWRGVNKWRAESKSVRVRDSEYHRRLAAFASLSLTVLTEVRPSKKEDKHTCTLSSTSGKGHTSVFLFSFFYTLLERL